ncbi:hypothetical protein DITRI_Ditri02bG0050200 [Diplodiscus trichospermus]
MASSMIINVPSSPSSSYQTAENEGEGRDSLEVETELSDLNQRCQGLEHEVSRLIFENVDNNEKLMSLKRRIEVFNQGENQLNREIEQLERKFRNLMLDKGLEDDKLESEKFGEEKETEGCKALKEKKLEQVFNLILDIGKNNDKFKDLSIGIEESKKCEESEVFHELGTDPGRQPVNLSELVSHKKELAEKFEKMGDVFDKVEWNDSDVENEIRKANMGDDGEDEEDIGLIGVRELCKEIELLEAMLERGSFGLLDLKLMMEEVEALKGPEKMMSEMEVKMGELETGLWELKNAIVELKGKKSKELKGWFTKEEENELECDGHEEANARKLNWGSIIATVGAVAVAAAAALIFMGHTRRVRVAAEKRNKHKSG